MQFFSKLPPKLHVSRKQCLGRRFSGVFQGKFCTKLLVLKRPDQRKLSKSLLRNFLRYLKLLRELNNLTINKIKSVQSNVFASKMSNYWTLRTNYWREKTFRKLRDIKNNFLSNFSRKTFGILSEITSNFLYWCTPCDKKNTVPFF